MFSWGGNPGVGSLHRLRDAVEHGWPRPLALDEFSHGAMAAAYDAGAANIPFATIRTHAGSLAEVNPHYRTVVCPFTGETLTAVPALRPDVTIIHAQQADREGNVLISGIIGVQKEAALAAKRVVVTVEEVVESFDRAGSNACILPRWTVEAIAVVPARRLALVRLRLLRPRQRLLSAVGGDLPHPRRLHRLDRRARDAAPGGHSPSPARPA